METTYLTYIRLHQSLPETGGLTNNFKDNSTIKQGKRQGFRISKMLKICQMTTNFD
jgi:hypothetical protein